MSDTRYGTTQQPVSALDARPSQNTSGVLGARLFAWIVDIIALFFYVAAGTVALWLLDIACGFVRADRRLGHDLLTGLVVVRA